MSATPSSNLPPAVGVFVKPVLPVADPETFERVRARMTNAFSASQIEAFLKSMTRGNMRIRDFDTVLSRELLGPTTQADYAKLAPADQGQIREIYLASVEKVSPDLRKKFLKLYAYY